MLKIGETVIAIEGLEVKWDKDHPAHLWSGDSRMLRVKFNNDRGASIIRFTGSYGYEEGKWEIAVIGKDGEIDYSTDLTSDVLGCLSEEEVFDTLVEISELAK